MTSPVLPESWTQARLHSFIVRDADGQQLAYVYDESEPGRRSAFKLLTKDEARKIAANGGERLTDEDNHLSRRSKMSPTSLATVGSRPCLAKGRGL